MDLRSRYEQAVRDLRELGAEMQRGDTPGETIARVMHAERRRLASLFKEQTPEPYRARIYERTVKVYRNEFGPSIEFLRALGKSWEAIIEGAIRPRQLIDLGSGHGDVKAERG
jgi:hypothetical protein